jgi:branched-chain amino acid transport system substrate-binding protein
MTDDTTLTPAVLQQRVDDAMARWQGMGSTRARCDVFSGVTPIPVGKPHPFHSSGRGTNEEMPAEGIVVRPPAPEREIKGRIQEFEPIRVGYLIDIDSGSLLGDCLDAAILAIEDTMNEGIGGYRPVEIVVEIGRGLPRKAARHTIDAYNRLCDAGCLVVMGPYTTDGAMAILPSMERRGVPCVSSNGAKAWHSKYGFTIGNGGVSEESAIMADWCRGQGHTNVACIVEDSPGGAEYLHAFQLGARFNRLKIVAEVHCETTGAGLKEGLAAVAHNPGIDALVYCGYGYPIAMVNPVLAELAWNPVRIQSTAFMWYINEPSMLVDMEGWVGIDQVGDDVGDQGSPNFLPMIERFTTRFGRHVRHAMIPNSYDCMRVIMMGLNYAQLLTPEGVVTGLERITMLPVTVGGPGAYVSFGPWDRKGYKGDFLTLRRVENAWPHWAGTFDRKLPSTIDG